MQCHFKVPNPHKTQPSPPHTNSPATPSTASRFTGLEGGRQGRIRAKEGRTQGGGGVPPLLLFLMRPWDGEGRGVPVYLEATQIRYVRRLRQYSVVSACTDELAQGGATCTAGAARARQAIVSSPLCLCCGRSVTSDKWRATSGRTKSFQWESVDTPSQSKWRPPPSRLSWRIPKFVEILMESHNIVLALFLGKGKGKVLGRSPNSSVTVIPTCPSQHPFRLAGSQTP